MPNHYHLLVRDRTGHASASMRDLNGRYARAFNRRHGRRGPLFDRRFHATPVEDDAHAIDCLRYIALNPAVGRLCARPGDWRWSSHRALCGEVRRPSWLTGQLLGADARAHARYQRLFTDDAQSR